MGALLKSPNNLGRGHTVQADRRTSLPRTGFDQEALVANAKGCLAVTCVDISLTGLFVEADLLPFRVGESVLVQIPASTLGSLQEFEAEVVRKSRFGYGLKFKAPPATLVTSISRYILAIERRQRESDAILEVIGY